MTATTNESADASGRRDDDLLDDVFHSCAFAAYVELAITCGGQPDEADTRRLAYRYYEEALAERHRVI